MRHRLRLISMAVLASCVTQTTAPPVEEQPVEPLEDYGEPGPWQAGTQDLEVEGPNGMITVQLWYPTNDTSETGVLYDGTNPGTAVDDATPDCATSHPLMVFSHGSNGVRWQTAFITEHLATHGWFVVAPDHPGNSVTDLFPDFEALITSRPRDVREVVDWIVSENANADSPWVGCVPESGEFAIMGHSFGGYTALAVGGAIVDHPTDGPVDLSDDRARAVVGLAPWNVLGWLAEGTADVAVPTLFITGEQDSITPIDQVRDLWDPLTAEPRWLGVMPNAGHFSFSPLACDFGFDGDGCGSEFLPIDDVARYSRQASTAFLKAFVEGDAPAAWEELPKDSPELVWETAE